MTVLGQRATEMMMDPLLFLGDQMEINMSIGVTAEPAKVRLQELHRMVVEDDDEEDENGLTGHFDFNQPTSDTPPMTNNTANSWYSTSSDEACFLPFDNHLSISATASVPNSAFLPYLSANGHQDEASFGKSGNGQSLQKRCIGILREIDRKRKEGQRRSIEAGLQEQQLKVSLQNKAAFHHMIAERNRRVKLKQHFQLLHSLLPSNSKKDKYSVLSNTGKYLNELLKKVKELEHANHTLQKRLESSMTQQHISSDNGGDVIDEENGLSTLYQSDEVVISGARAGAHEVTMRINVDIANTKSTTTETTIFLLDKLKQQSLDIVSMKSGIHPTTNKFQAYLRICRDKESLQGEGQESRGRWEDVAKAVRSIFS